MQVKIITNKEGQKYDVEIIQKNKNPIQFKPFCEYNEKFNIIFVSVPACESNAINQFGNCWKEFVNSYISSINEAILLNKKIVLMPELGENLLWKDCLIIKAAREALERVNKCSDDFIIIFFINKEKYKLWDEMMQFG